MGRKRTGTLIWRDGVAHAQVTVGEVGNTRREFYTLGTSDPVLAQQRLAHLNKKLAAGPKRPRVDTLAVEVPEVRKSWDTFREHADAWIKEREADKVVSARDEKNNLVRYVYDHIGDKPLNAVKATDVKRVLQKAADAGLSRETQRKIRGVMLRVFQAAVADGKVQDNPVAALPKRKRGGLSAASPVKKKRTILTDAEIAAYLACATVDEELQLMSLVARVEGGMRTSDVNRWDWKHITTTDFATCVVPRSKTDEPQVLAVPQVLRGRLRARWETAGRPESGPVFPVRRGANKGGFRATRGISFAARLRRDLKRAGLTRHDLFHETATTLPVDFHSFRRAFNTALAVANVNVQTAMRLAGHSDERTHMRYVMDAPAMREIPEAAIPKLTTEERPRRLKAAKERRLLRRLAARRSAPRATLVVPDSATTSCDSVSDRAENLARHARFEPATFGSGGRLRDPECAANRSENQPEPTNIYAALHDVIHRTDQIAQRIATVDPDPDVMLVAFAAKRGEEARAIGEALAWRVLRRALDNRQVQLAIAVLRGGPHVDHRMLDLVETLTEAAEESRAA